MDQRSRHFWDFVVDYQKRYKEYLERKKKVDSVGEEAIRGTLHEMEVGLRAIEENLKLSSDEIRGFRREAEREVTVV